jgi:hypothetical protein
MAQAKKETGLGTARTSGLPKKTVKRAHHIGDVIKGQMTEGKRQFMIKLSEGINFTEMMRERDRSLSELLAELQDDIKSFKDTGHCTDFLRDCLEVHGFGKKQLQDSAHPKRGDSFAPQYPEIPPAKPSFLDRAKSLGSKALDKLGHPGDEEMIQDLKHKTMGETDELNELARLAGLTVESKTCPTCHADPCKCEDMEEVDGKTYPVKESHDDTCTKCDCDPCECDDGDKDLAKLKENCGIVSPIAGGAQQMQSAEEQKGNLSVNTSADNKGHKTVTITADGEEAEKLAELLKLAGMGGHQPQVHQAEIVVAQEAKEYGDTEVEEPEEVMNTPRPDLQGMHRSPTTGFNKDTDDLHKPKSQHPTAAAKGDNPLTKKEKTIEDFNPIDNLGAQLMAEYQSIKLAK